MAKLYRKRYICLLLAVLHVLCFVVFLNYYSGNIFLENYSKQSRIAWIYHSASIACSNKTKTQTVNVPSNTAIPRIVHLIMWNDKFTFRNYLSILSVSTILKPFIIILYTNQKVKRTKYDYDNWYEKAVSNIPNLQVVQLGFRQKLNHYFLPKDDIILSVLNENGGIYINLDTVITADLWLHINGTFYAGLVDDSSIGFLAVSPNSNEIGNVRNKTKTYVCRCVSLESYSGADICISTRQDFFPVDIMWDSSPFASLARSLFYGSPNFPSPNTSFPPIPKIVHYIWFGPDDIDFTMRLSFISTQQFVKPEKIFIYTDTKVRRKYFDEMAAHSNVEVIFYSPVKYIYQNKIAKYLHSSDIVRAEILLRFGGIYLDWDVYWLKPIDDLLTLGYETIASLDFYKDMYPREQFPDTINLGVVLARPNSRFIKLWQDSFKQYSGKEHHTFHAVELPYKLYEERPDLLVIHRRLQVMCHYSRCHPLWLDDYKNGDIHHEFDFTKDAYSVHITSPTPAVFTSENVLKGSKGFIAEMGQHILGKSTVLPHSVGWSWEETFKYIGLSIINALG